MITKRDFFCVVVIFAGSILHSETCSLDLPVISSSTCLSFHPRLACHFILDLPVISSSTCLSFHPRLACHFILDLPVISSSTCLSFHPRLACHFILDLPVISSSTCLSFHPRLVGRLQVHSAYHKSTHDMYYF